MINKNLYQYANAYKNITLVYYEDLVHKPEKTIHKITQFLSISNDFKYSDYQKYYANFVKQIESSNTIANKERWIKKFGDLSRPINPSAIGKWKNRLTQQQIEDVNSICFDTAKLFYPELEVSTKSISYSSGYYKALLNFHFDNYRYYLPPKFNMVLENVVRKTGII